MTLYAKISRPNLYPGGYGYICDLKDLKNMIDCELDGIEEWAETDEIIQIEIVDVKDEEYKNLKEFVGW
jgi:hypothetical protein